MMRYPSEAGDAAAYLASAQPSPGSPVLLLHPWWGLNQTIRDLADRLAGDGFTVMAPDMFDGTVLTTPEDAEAHVRSLTEADGDRIRAHVLAALDHLMAHPERRGDPAALLSLCFGALEATEVSGGPSAIA